MSESRTTAAMRRCDWPANRAADGRAPCAAGGEDTVPQELGRMPKRWAPCGEPSSLGTSRYPVGCPMCTVPDKRGKGLS
jgi:hypothetical protein